MEQNKAPKKKNKTLQRILMIIILVCLSAAAFFLYKYFDDINSQYRNAETALISANDAIKKGDDLRNTQPACGTPIGKVRIEGVTDDMPIIFGEGLDCAMNRGVGMIDPATNSTASWPGTLEGKQPALSAHRETFFSALRNVSTGDTVVVTMPYGTFKYKITNSIIINPEDGAKVYNTKGIAADSERLVLITCYPFNVWQSPNKRIAFFADLVE